MHHCYVEFRVRSVEQLERLKQTVNALREAKLKGSFPADDEWKPFFSEEEIATFWWPSEDERKDWERRWFSTPVGKRFNDPSLETPWDFGSMLEAIRDGEYAIVAYEPNTMKGDSWSSTLKHTLSAGQVLSGH